MEESQRTTLTDYEALKLLALSGGDAVVAARENNISIDELRARARCGLLALCPPVDLPTEVIETLADYLLGQIAEDGVEQIESILRKSSTAALWSQTVETQLDKVRAGETVAAIKTDSIRTKIKRTHNAKTLVVASVVGGIVSALVVLAVVRPFGSSKPAKVEVARNSPADVKADAKVVPIGEIKLHSTGAAKAQGVMSLYVVNNQLAFTIRANKLKPNSARDRYAVWITSKSGVHRLGFVAKPVTKDQKLAITGPEESQLKDFPAQIATAEHVIVTRETSGDPLTPGEVVLSGEPK